MKKEIRAELAYRLVDGHASASNVDAPTLTHGVAGPGEENVALVARNRAKGTDDRLAPDASVLQVLEHHAIDDALTGRQARQLELGGEVPLLQRIGTENTMGILERGGLGIFHD